MSYHGDAILDRLPVFGECRVAELGVGSGQLSDHLLKCHHGLRLWMVDRFDGGRAGYAGWCRDNQDPYGLRTPEVVAEHMRDAIEVANRWPGRVTLVVSDSATAAERVRATLETDPPLLDIAYLDADHRHEAVVRDIEAWWPLVKPGGWIGGHDYGRFDDGVKRGVDTFAASIGLEVETDDDWTWFVRRPGAAA